MTKKRKKIIKTIIFSGLMLCLFRVLIVNASTTPIIHYIFDKQSIKQGEEFSLTLILENYQELSTVQFVCEVDEKVFIPIIKDGNYFVEPTLSLFESDEIYENIYLDEEDTLRFVAITKGGKSYDYSGLNQVFTIYFQAKQDINDVEQYFYESDSFGSRTLLIDKKAKEIEAEVSYNEILKATWEKSKYEVEVYGEIPNVVNDIIILNRQSSEYKIEVLTETLELNVIGSTVIKVKVYDYITSQVIYLAKPVLVVDRTAPLLEVKKKEVVLEDIKIEVSSFDYFKVTDNYDQNPTLIYKYYNEKNEEITNLSDFKKYLKNNLIGKITCYALDSSNNKSKEQTVVINIKDTTAPYINVITELEILDIDIDEFDFESLIIVSDEYDLTPQIKKKIKDLNGNNYNDVLTPLKKFQDIIIEYWAVDTSNNESKHIELKIKLIDTIAPTLNNVNDIVILDADLNLYLMNHHLLEQDFEIKDNFNREVSLKILYFDNDQNITEDEFFNNLSIGKAGVIRYQVVDSFGNKSEEFSQKVSVSDVTAPVIVINNLEDGKQYLGPLKLDYQVQDNLDQAVKIEVTINDNVYNGEEIIDFGKYVIKIIATDFSGNTSTAELTFEIVEENFFGCIDGMDCAENNYAVGILIGIIIVVIVGGVVTFEIIYLKKKKRQETVIEE